MNIREIEKKILGKIAAIKRGEMKLYETGTPNIGQLFTLLKDKDLPLYEKLIKDYKMVLDKLKKENI